MSIRCFIAIEVPGDLQDGMGRIQERLRAADVKVRWASPGSIHLTTKFLGDVGDDDIPRVCEVMKRAAAHTPLFELEIAGLGTFPPKGPPHVVWVGVSGDTETLGRLVEEIERGIAGEVGIRPEHRAYHPHLTLGRVKSTRNTEDLRTLMAGCGPVRLGTFTADGLTLFMSKLSSEGSLYTPMAHMTFEA